MVADGLMRSGSWIVFSRTVCNGPAPVGCIKSLITRFPTDIAYGSVPNRSGFGFEIGRVSDNSSACE